MRAIRTSPRLFTRAMCLAACLAGLGALSARAQTADLVVVKAGQPNPVGAGSNLTYTIIVHNAGPDAATAVTLADVLPAQVNFVSASAGCSESLGVVTCAIGGLAVNNSITLTLVVNSTTCSTLLTNMAYALAAETDPDPDDNTNTTINIVTDLTAPALTCPANISVQCEADVPAANIAGVTALDNCDPSPVVTFEGDVTNGTCPKIITRTYKAVDASNNMATCTQIITVQDTTPPTINCGMNETVQCGVGWGFTVPIIADNCDPSPVLSIVSTVTNQTCGNTYVATRVWQVADFCNNLTTCTQVVTVVDTMPPSITCPGNISTKTVNPAGAVISFTPTSTDVCDPSPNINCVPASGSTFPIGVTTVNCSATDDCGNTTPAPCTFTVTLQLQHTTSYPVGTAIPDGNINGLASTKIVATSIGIISDVNVTFKTTGGYNGDLYAYLTHDSGFCVLLNRVGRTSTDAFGYGDAGINATFDDTAASGDAHIYRFTLNGSHATPLGGPLTNSIAPDGRATDPAAVLDTDARTELLSSFNGLNPNGSWTLFVADLSSVDIATLDSWGLDICGFLPIPASIPTQSGDLALECSSNAVFTVTTAGTGPLTNQWYFNGSAIAGSNGLSLYVPDVHPASTGVYSFAVCNMAGCATSAPIVLTLVDTIAPVITACAASLTNCADLNGQSIVPDWTGLVISTEACSSVTVTQTPLAGTVVSIGNTTVTLTAFDTSGNSASCSAVLTVAGPPSITSQPVSLVRPMGNSATFNVTTTSVVPVTYQWQTNGVDVSGATSAGLTVGPLTLAQDGEQYRVIVSNCAGSVTSVVAVLGVTPITGIAFDFNTPNQYSNAPFNIVSNHWMNSLIQGGLNNPFLPVVPFEVPTGGVGVATGGGGLDLAFNNNQAQSSTLHPVSFDFSLPGKTLVASAMMKIKFPLNNTRSTQIGFTTLTNIDLDNRVGLTYMTVIMQSLNQPGLNYDVRSGSKSNTVNSFIEGNGTAATTLATNQWYKLTATFINSNAVQMGTYRVSATLQHMGGDGLAPVSTVATMGPVTISNIDVTSARNLHLVVRNIENTGVDYLDNIYVHTATGPVYFVAQPQSRTVGQGRQVTWRALVDGDGPYTYQWNLNGTPIPNAGSWTYTTPPLLLSDSGASYTVTVTSPNNTITSDPAVVTVTGEDLNVVSVGSVNGASIGLRFDQPVTRASAENAASYLIDGVAAYAAQLLANQTDVVLTPASTITAPFTVTVTAGSVMSLSGTAVVAGGNTAAGRVEGLTGYDVNPVVIGADRQVSTIPGFEHSFAAGSFEVSGGGHDISGQYDGFRFVYKPMSGDFDVKMRVPYQDLLRTQNRAGFDARVSLDPASPSVFADVNPMLPGLNRYEGNVRQTYNAPTTSWGNNTACAYPNVWLRFRRSGNTFLRYSSVNGVNWQLDGQTSPVPAFPETVYMGLAVCANVGQGGLQQLVRARIEGYGDFAGYPGAAIAMVSGPSNITVNAGSAATFTNISTFLTNGVPFATTSELSYLWQRTNTAAGGWTNMPSAGSTANILNTGALYFSDDGAHYRVIISAPGAVSVTSSVARLSINDGAAPTVASTLGAMQSPNQLLLTFSEFLDAATALNAANYNVTNGFGVRQTVASVAFLNGDPRTIVITTVNELVGGTNNVGITGVLDLKNNPVAVGTIARIVQSGAPTAASGPQLTGPVVMEYYTALANFGGVHDMVNNPKYRRGVTVPNGSPDFIVYSNVFGIHPTAGFPSSGWGEQFGVKMYSFFRPPTTAAYRFYTRLDDFGELWVNTNPSPALSTLPLDVVIGLSSNSPAFQQAWMCMDGVKTNNGNSKYLAFDAAGLNTGFYVTPAVGGTVIGGIRFWAAGDAPERDPLTFTIAGSPNTGTNGPWTAIAAGNTGIANTGGAGTGRYMPSPDAMFTGNTTNYRSYRVIFPTVRGPSQNSMQIGEVEFLSAAGAKIIPSGATLLVQQTANNPAFTVPNSSSNTVFGSGIPLNAGQLYYMELRYKEGGGGDGATVAIRTDTAIPASTEVISNNFLVFPTNLAPATPVQMELYTAQLTINPFVGLMGFNASGSGAIQDLITGTNLTNFIARIPNVAGFESQFGFNTNRVSINDTLNNYLGRLYAHFVPPTNGLYKFYLQVDDTAQLLMNTNAANSTDPAGAVVLGQIINFSGAANQNIGPFIQVQGNSGAYNLIAQNISLVGGQRYYLETRWREGGGGDGVNVAVRSQGDAAIPGIAETISPAFLELATNEMRMGPIKLAGITPSSPVVTEGQSITFQAVGLSGAFTAQGANFAGGTTVQGLSANEANPLLSMGLVWMKNGQNILADQVFAGQMFYKTPPLTTADHGSVITLLVSNTFSVATRSVTISVTADTTAPSILSAVASQYGDSVLVTFSEPVDPATAQRLSAYRVSGLAILGVDYDELRRDRVNLRTGPQTPGIGYTLVVNGVRDLSLAGNTLFNGMINFGAWGFGGRGALLVELFTNIQNTSVDWFATDPKFINNMPDISYYTNVFAAGGFGADTGGSFYAARISGLFMPPSNGLYRFFVRGDDGSRLFMNTNGPSPAGQVLIARNDGAGSAYLLGIGLGRVGQSISPILSLTNGTPYWMEAWVKEGAGSDYLGVVMRAIDPGTGLEIGGVPATPAAADAVGGIFFQAPGNPDINRLIVVSAPPAELFVEENSLVTLTLSATALPASLNSFVSYQWQRSNALSGVFTNVPGATASTLLFFAPLVDDNAAYRILASIPGTNVSYTTLLHVVPDETRPYIVSASSLNGTNVNLRFNEPVTVDSGNDPFAYEINGMLPNSAVLHPDGRSVTLEPSAPLGGPGSVFTVSAYSSLPASVVDMAGLESTNVANGIVQGFVPLDVGAPAGGGSSFSSLPGEMDVIAGGSDIWGTSDIGHLTLRPICGDFDIWTRVHSLSRAPGDNDGITKGGLMIRESFDPASRKMQVLVEPPLGVGGRAFYEAGQRTNTGLLTGGWTAGNATGTGPVGIPNAWIRIKRTGDTFIAYRGTDGINWTAATTNITTSPNAAIAPNITHYPQSLLVGFGTTAHVPVPSASTTFAEYRDIHIPNPPAITVQASPASQIVGIHQSVSYTVTAVNPPDSGPLLYQWRKDGVRIPGATSATLTIPNTSVADSGAYLAEVYNDGGCDTNSQAVVLIVTNALPALVNDMLTATQGLSVSFPAADHLGNDTDPEGDGLSVVAVSGIAPVTYATDFNSGLPAGSVVFGNALVDTTGGVGGGGTLKITVNANSQSGSWILNELTPGRKVTGFTTSFQLRIGDGTAEPADGFSFNFAGDLPIAATTPAAAENGGGTGFSFCVDNYRFAPYPAGGAVTTSGMKIRHGGVDIAGIQMPTWNSPRFVPVSITLTPQGLLTVLVDGTNVFGNVILPGHIPRAGRFGMYARTGGANEAHFVDDFSATVLTLETTRPLIAGATFHGNAYHTNQTGAGNSGSLHLTDAINGQGGALILDDLLPGRSIASFSASFGLQIGSGSADGADGFSLNLAADIPNGPSFGAEDGVGSGLSICVDNFSGGTLPAGPALRVKYGGVFLASVQIPKWNSPAYVPMTVVLDADGTVDVIVDGTNALSNIATPFVPATGTRFGLHARTGGLNQRHWVDNLAITATAVDYSIGSFASNFDNLSPGTVTLAGGVITYTPPSGACGTDAYYYVVSDGQAGGLSAARVDVAILEAVPTAPFITQCPTNRTLAVLPGLCFIEMPDLTGQVGATDNCCCLTKTQSPAPGSPIAIGATVTVIFTVTDTGGLSTTCTADITAIDATPPEILCPPNIVTECTGSDSATVNYSVLVSDNCNPAPLLVCTPPSGSVFPLGTNAVSCTVNDGNGNSASCGFTVTVLDTTPPVIACQANILVNLTVGQCAAVVNYAAPTFSDCDNTPAIVCTPPSGSSFPSGTNVVNCTVTDDSGNASSCSFIVAVIEIVRPVITIPADLVIECGDSTLPANTGTATATDNCDPNPLVTYVDHGTIEIHPGGMGGWTLAAIGDPLTATATLVNGSSGTPLGTGSLRLTIGSNGENIARARTTNFHGVRLDALTELSYRTHVIASSGGETPLLVLNIDSDNNGSADDIIVFEPEYQSGYTVAVPAQGPVVNGVWQSWDAMIGGWWSANNSGVASEGAGVKPLSAYLAVYPNARIVNSSGAGGVRIEAGEGLGAWEDFDGYADRLAVGVSGSSIVHDFDATAGNPNPLIARTWTAMDDSGNLISGSQIINIVDTTPPVVTCPAGPVAEGNTTGGATVSYTTTVSDICDASPVLVCAPASGSFFPLGLTTVNCLATDNVGNSNACSFVVTVVDTTAPVVVCSTNITAECAGASSAPVSYVVTATDIVDASPAIVCTPASGSSFAMGTTTVNCTATDGSANGASCSFTVTIVDTTPPVIVTCAPAATVPADATCQGTLPDLTGLVSATDCNSFTVTQSPLPGALLPIGPNNITLTVTDSSGNPSTCTAVVTVADGTAPVVTCPANITVEGASPAGTMVTFTATAADNCTPSLTVVCTPASGSTFPLGTTTVNCTTADAASNGGSCSFTVSVVDTTAPVRCANPPVSVAAGGTNDNFTGTEAASPSADLEDLLVSVALRDFDDAGSDKTFGHTVDSLPANISDAILRIKLRADSGLPQNDVIELLFTTPGGGVLAQSWSRRIGTGGFDAVPGLLANPWAAGQETELVLDLSKLPNAGGGFTDLIPTLRGQQFVDVIVGGDTMVDYVVLDVTTCECQADITVNVDTNTCGAVVNFITPAFTDIVDTSVSVVCTPASGSTFPVGTTTVFCRGTDDSGNVGRCSFDVTVVEPVPAVRVRFEGGLVIVSWPITCTNYRLLQTTSLNAPVTWTPYVGPVSILGGEYQVGFTPTGAHRYFRLVTP